MSKYSRTQFYDHYLLLPYTSLTRHYLTDSLVWDLIQRRLEVTDDSRQPRGSIFKSQTVRVDLPKSIKTFLGMSCWTA